MSRKSLKNPPTLIKNLGYLGMESSQKSHQLFFIIGPTASGKNAVARAIAPRLDAEIISLDSMKVYRHLDIGTAKPVLDSSSPIKYHLIDLVEPWESFNLARFIQECEKAIQEITSRNKYPLLVVGTPLYLKGLLEGVFKGPGRDESIRTKLKLMAQGQGTPFLYDELKKIDPVKASQLHPNDLRRISRALEVYLLTGRPISALQTQSGTKRTDYQTVLVGLRREPADLAQRIDQRVAKMFKSGLIEETRQLLNSRPSPTPEVLQAIGYQEITRYLKGELILEETKKLVKQRTRHLVKHQMTWFRRFPEIQWLEIRPVESPQEIAVRMLEIFKASNKMQ